MNCERLIVLDMDGVITSEEGYWKAAACTIVELAGELGHAASRERLSAEIRPFLPAELSLPKQEIASIKSLSINTNWDLCHLAACTLVYELALSSPLWAKAMGRWGWADKNVPLLAHWPAGTSTDLAHLLQRFLALELPGQGFALMEALASRMNMATLPSFHYGRQGPLWQWCYHRFQRWFAGSDWERGLDAETEDGILHSESLLLPAEKIRSALECLRQAGWRLAIATGRTRSELLPTLQRHHLLESFEQDRIVTHDEIHTAEVELQSRGRAAQLAKPSPFPFLRALFPGAPVERLAFAEAPSLHGEIVFVGDTVGDMAPARLLNVRGVAVLTGAGGPAAERLLREAGATDVLADITGLPDLLAGLSVPLRDAASPA